MKLLKAILNYIALGLILTFGSFVAAQGAKPEVGKMIVFALDVSGSVDGDEMKLQMDGLAAAFRDPEVVHRLQSCNPKGVGVASFFWSSNTEDIAGQAILPWFHIKNGEDALAYADLIERARPHGQESTFVTRALAHALMLMKIAPFTSKNKIVSISSDGYNNVTVSRFEPPMTFDRQLDIDLARARKDLLDQDIAIDALTIEDPVFAASLPHQVSSVNEWYRRFVIGGENARLDGVSTYKEYGAAIKAKILTLMCPVMS